MMGQRLRLVVWGGLVVAIVLFCISTVDKPLANLVASYPARVRGLRFLIGAPGLLLGVGLFVPLLNWKVERAATRFRHVALLCSRSILWTASAVELFLKRIFGRTGPGNWLNHYEYSFHWFRGQNAGWQSMPSGEVALLASALGILWVTHPRYRWVYALTCIAEAVGLVWLNWHFASDVIAGTAIGVLSAILVLRHA